MVAQISGISPSPISDVQKANRFLAVASTAKATNRIIGLGYTAGDTSGTAFGCAASDCRYPWVFTLK